MTRTDLMSRCGGIALVTALVTASGPEPALAQEVDADVAAIHALIEETEAANNAGDVERWVALFGEEFVYMAPGAPAVTTRADLVEVARAGFRNEAEISIDPVEIQVLPEGWAFARSHVTGEVTVRSTGEVVSVDVKQLVIYRRHPDTGAWRITRLISNSNG